MNMSKRVKSIFMYLLCFSLFITSFSLIDSEYVNAEKESILIIGDSRVYGMSQYCNDKANYYFYCETGVGTGFINSSTLESTLGSVTPNSVANDLTGVKSGKVNLKQAIKDKGIKTIIYELGVNGCGTNGAGASTAVDTMKKLKSETGCDVYFITVMPGDENKAKSNNMTISNSGIEKFNNAVKSGVGSDVKVIDTYKYVSDYSNWGSHCSDGVHYDSTLYNDILSYVISNVGSNSSSNSGSGSDGSWCKVKIKQGGVGHTSGCTVCTLQLILQNSGELKENQLNGEITSATSEYTAFDSACTSAGFQSGDAWIIGKVPDGFTSLCNSSWKSESGSGSITADYNGITALTGINGKKFTEMTDSEQVTSMKTLYNSGYFVIFCVRYANSTPDANGPAGYKAQHATMLAGVTEDEIYINDPANGAIRKYSEATSGSSGAYELVYCILLKNDNVSLLSLSGGNNAGVTESDEQNAENLGISVQAISGAYSESQLSNYFTMNEVSLEMADSGSLTVGQTYTLNNWVNTIDSDTQDTVLVTWMRRIVTWIGIAFTLWMIFLYLAYWFDRVNVFFEFSLLPILSFNRLMVSPDENKCTWQFSEMIKAKSDSAMTVNNRAMLEIVIIGCIFGGLIISGVLFKIVRIIVIGVLKLLHIV